MYSLYNSNTQISATTYSMYAQQVCAKKHKDLRCLLSNLYVDFFMIAWMKNKALSALGGVRIKPYTLNIRNESNMIFYLIYFFTSSIGEMLVLFL